MKSNDNFLSLSEVYKMLGLPTESQLTDIGIGWMIKNTDRENQKTLKGVHHG